MSSKKFKNCLFLFMLATFMMSAENEKAIQNKPMNSAEAVVTNDSKYDYLVLACAAIGIYFLCQKRIKNV